MLGGVTLVQPCNHADVPTAKRGVAFHARTHASIRARSHDSVGPAREVDDACCARPRDRRDEDREARGGSVGKVGVKASS